MFRTSTPDVRRALIGGGLCSLALLYAAPAQAAIKPGTVYGTAGTTGAAGEVRAPEGIGVDPISGRVALADYSNSRVSVFEPDGTFVLAFGKDVDPGGGTGPEVCTTTCKAGVAGPEAGALDSPYEAEFSPSGNRIFVGEGGNGRVSVFTKNGVFLRAFGADVIPGGGTGPEVCTATTTCQKGVNDGTGGSFAQVWPLTFGPDGLVYVADSGGGRIAVYEPSGIWLRTFGEDVVTGGDTGFEVCTVAADCKAGTASGTAGAIESPQGLDFAPDGRLWVGDGGENRIVIFNLDPLAPFAALGKDVLPGGGLGFEVCTTLCQAGTAGAGPGELNSPNGVGVGADGLAFVGDPGNQRVDAYRTDPSFAFALGADVIPGGGVGFETCTSACQAGLENEATGFDYPYAVAVDCHGTAYVTSDVAAAVPARSYAEPGIEPGPCRFAAQSVKRDTRKGTAKLGVSVPYASKLAATGKGIKRATGSHTGLEGPEKLAIKPKGKLAKTLRRKGKAKVRVTVTMGPSDGNVAQTANKTVKLKRKRR